MIDVTKPLELADGTPVHFVKFDEDDDIVVRLPGGIERVYNPNTGAHWLQKEKPRLRNIAETKPAAPRFDPSKPARTRDGRKVRIICTDAKDANLPIVVLVTADDGGEHVLRYTADGRLLCKHAAVDRPSDLVNVSEPIVSYVNAYEDHLGPTHRTEALADARGSRFGRGRRLAVLKIAYSPEEGASVEVVRDYTSQEPIV